MAYGTGRCNNERCRARGLDQDVFVGEWFVDDPVLCPLCGELMEAAVQVGVAPVWGLTGPGWRSPGGWRQPPRPGHRKI
jgi:hypothetical protein